MRKTIITLCILGISLASFAQDQGIGIRLGDPAGITYKKYMGENALEISVGRTRFVSGSGYYKTRYKSWYEKKNYDYVDFDYIGYSSSTPIAIQVHYLFQNDISELDGLQWYYGAGAQLGYQTYRFDYRYRVANDNTWYYETGERVTDIDLGVDGVVGLEYTFEEVPVSVFLDATLFMEVADNPFAFWFQGGIGGRYNF